jgi:exopolysaccharide production protein ExoQ
MPPSVAWWLWFVLLLALLRYDPARRPDTSIALWFPVIWLFIAASRLPSQWLGVGTRQMAAQAFEEGSGLDRIVYLVVITLAVGILIRRGFDWSQFLQKNSALAGIFALAVLSIAWSDFPFVTFKRVIRDSGTYLVILVVITDTQPLEAFRTVIRRICFLLLPLSILLVKYYTEIGRQYAVWSGETEYIGATTSKNMLGLMCLIAGLFFFWDTLVRWPERKDVAARRAMLVNVIFIWMTVWLLLKSDSATATACLALGCAVIAATHSNERRPTRAFLIQRAIPVAIAFYLFGSFVLGIDFWSTIAPLLGREATLTGRTEIWRTLITMQYNPLLGAGYESFWLGSRLAMAWNADIGTINEAHNGYLQVYLNLGLIGLLLVCSVLISTYRTILRNGSTSPAVASLGLALWTVAVAYNVTEAAFLGGVLWTTFLMCPGLLYDAAAQGEQLAQREPAHVKPRQRRALQPRPVSPNIRSAHTPTSRVRRHPVRPPAVPRRKIVDDATEPSSRTRWTTRHRG